MKYVMFVLFSCLSVQVNAADYFLTLKGEPLQGALIIGQTNPQGRNVFEPFSFFPIGELGYLCGGFFLVIGTQRSEKGIGQLLTKGS